MNKMVTQTEKVEESKLELEAGSAKITLTDVYVLFYIMLKQSQKQKPGSKVGFDINAFRNMPKKVEIAFEQKNGKLFAWVPEKRNRKKRSRIYLPHKKSIVTR